MTFRARVFVPLSRPLTTSAVALLCVVAAASTATAQDLVLRASAGLEGQARPGRWTPIRIVATSSREISGTLEIEWGEARLERSVSLSPGSAKEFELYVRSDDPRDVVSVRVVSGGGSIASVDTPVRVVPYDPDGAEFVVCGPNGAAASFSGTCSVTLAPSAFPRSWRGLNAADDFSVSDEDRAVLDADQRRALGLAIAQARLNYLGLGAPTLGAVPAERSFPSRPSTILLAYVAIALVALAAAQWRRSAAATLAVLFAGGCTASAALYASGRVGGAAAVVLHHAASLDHYEGVDAAILTLRGVAEFPALDTYTLRADAADGALVTADDTAATVQYDASGLPTLAGRYALGATVPVRFDASVSMPLVRLERQGAQIRITNVSAIALSDCTFSASLTPARAGSFAPGTTIAATAGHVEDDPSLTCTMAGSPVRFDDLDHPVRMNGTTAVVLHLAPGSDHAETGTDR